MSTLTVITIETASNDNWLFMSNYQDQDTAFLSLQLFETHEMNWESQPRTN